MEAAKNPAPFEILLRAILLTDGSKESIAFSHLPIRLKPLGCPRRLQLLIANVFVGTRFARLWPKCLLAFDKETSQEHSPAGRDRPN